MHPTHRNPFAWQTQRRDGEISVFLVRHGQTAWNKERRFLGRTDIPLDDTGREQARRLAAALAPVEFTAIYSSPLSRASQTAEAIATERGIKIKPVAGLTELNQGELEGRYGADLETDFPEFYAQWKADPTHARVPGGETLAECSERANAALADILSRHEPNQAIAVVAHRVSISAILASTLELPVRFNMRIGQRNTAINLLGYRDGAIQLRRLNDASHLD